MRTGIAKKTYHLRCCLNEIRARLRLHYESMENQTNAITDPLNINASVCKQELKRTAAATFCRVHKGSTRPSFSPMGNFPCRIPAARLLGFPGRAFLLFSLFSFAFAAAASAKAAPGPAWQEAAISLEGSKRTIDVNVPDGARRIALEVMDSKGRWIRWTTRKVPVGIRKMALKIPARAALLPWRAWAEVPVSPKFPAAFYRGKKAFGKAASSGYGEPDTNGALLRVGSVASVASDTTKSGDGAKTEEADIWKAEGNTVFFFNQLRGLQVLDLSNPAEPLLVCSLRLPAVGQDLYVLPEAGGVRHALLLARDPEDWDATVVHLVRISNGEAVLAASRKFPGILADSRLKGNRLFLASQTWRDWQAVGQDRVVLREVLVDAAAGSLSDGASFELTGAWPVVSAGNDWIAVATSDWNEWNVSKAALFSISDAGLARLNPEPIRTAGRIQDKFKMQVRDGVFSVFSQGWLNADGQWAGWGTPVTMLENFSVAGEKLATLEIIRDEQLFATRFAGDTAYAVTFEQVDPLWVIDLSNPAAPAITGHLEVPGWSTHIEPVGDMLFSIGWDEGRVAASLFDVADPANPTLASRVFLSESWAGFSESLYNEKALKILPDENLVLIPFSVHWSESGDTGHRVQLLEIDSAAKALHPRGRIAHDFEPRRSAMVGGALASISQRQLVTADISNRENPRILADLLLAWPVQRVEAAGEHLFQIADGSTWWDAAPALRVSNISDVDSILAELPLGNGTVLDATIRDGRLLVLRGEGLGRRFPWIFRSISGSASTSAVSASSPALALDIYDVANPLSPLPVGSTKVELGSDSANWETSRMVFPSPGTVAVLARRNPSWWWGGWWPRPMPVRVGDVSPRILPASVSIAAYDWEKVPGESSLAVLFQPSLADATTLELPADKTIALDAVAAADGLVVFGCGDRISDWGSPESRRGHHAGILDLANPSAPVLREPLALPGRLLAVTELDRRGFLAWTQQAGSDGEPRGLSVGACDMREVYLVDSLANIGPMEPAIEGRRVFVSDSGKIQGFCLEDNGRFRSLGFVQPGFNPDAIRVTDSHLCAATYNRFAAIPVGSFPGTLREWISGPGVELKNTMGLPDGSFASPAGDYGVEVFK